MLACIPTQGKAGAEDRVHEHFGSAPFFTLYDSTTGEVKILDNRDAHHSHGTCHPMNQLTRYHIDCVICRGMGRRAIMALAGEGIQVYQAESEMVNELIEKIKAGSLTPIDPTKACSGQGLHGGCEAPGSGRGSGLGQTGKRGSGREG